MLPALRELKPIDAWAGLRPVGHPNNYYIEFSKQIPHLLHVAGIRSTGLSACLGISEYAVKLLQERGLRVLQPSYPSRVVGNSKINRTGPPWWERHNTNHGVDSKEIVAKTIFVGTTGWSSDARQP